MALQASQRLNIVESQGKVSLRMLNQRGIPVGTLLISAIGNGKLISLDPKEAKDLGEEPVQLIEGLLYQYQLTGTPRGSRLKASDVVLPDRIYGERRSTGRIRPGSHAGLLLLALEDQFGSPIGTAQVEVRSSKLSYREEYRCMLEYVSLKCIDLLLEMRAPLQTRLLSDPSRQPDSVQQRFASVKSILDSREFREALQRITAMPHRLLQTEEQDVSVRRGFAPDAKSLRQLSYRSPRTPLPDGHPLAVAMRARGVRNPSLPTHVIGTRHRDTVDTAENRFVKHTLTTYSDFLNKTEKALFKGGTNAEQRLLGDVSRLRKELDAVLTQDFYREISEPDILPLGSPVLQRKPGYTEVLKAWLRFNTAARLDWGNDGDAYGASKREVEVLYECWLFFQLLELVATRCGMSLPAVGSFIEHSSDGFRLRLKSEQEFALVLSSGDDQTLRMRLDYHRELPPMEQREPTGSWTRKLRPDFTLSVWPADLPLDEATSQGFSVQLSFDAKYWAEPARGLLGKVAEEVRGERNEQRRGITKRGDLRKMHAYREIVMRSRGSYILYPGNGARPAPGLHEILPGVEAFAVRPALEGGAQGMEALSDLLEVVIGLVRERTILDKQTRYRLNQMQKERAHLGVVDRILAMDPLANRAEASMPRTPELAPGKPLVETRRKRK